MTEESTPYYSPANQERQSDRLITFAKRPLWGIALTHSEWVELKITLNNEIARQIQDGSYTALRLEGLQQLRTACRLRQQSRLQEID